MKKRSTFLIITLLVSTSSVYAGTGSANDGIFLILGVAGVLLIIAAFLHGIDFIRNNGKRIVKNTIIYAKQKIHSLFDLFNQLHA